MKIWLDAQLSPSLADWITNTIQVETVAIRDLGLLDASDELIFAEGNKANVIIMTKDSDFLRLVERKGTPPKIIWLTCGNTSNANLQRILAETLKQALELLESGDSLVEIRARASS